ncbi:hypothetical protein [Fibrella aquatilis]|uniref:Uncharacterized protein n=1 Tax=Fibrella aquatilis TaxID=2817059 RepID=A0A939G5P6_9BACT|nr:hypothetical protein [Fibrella aquatilis]MBO0930692.1 hypothetical protein [Fibrella aquatilis]
MNDLTDNPLHNRVRQSLTEHEPAVDPHESGQDWLLLRPRLFPHKQRPLSWVWLLALVGLVGGLGWYFLDNEPPKKAPIISKEPISVSERPATSISSLPETPISSPIRILAQKPIASPRHLALRTVNTGTSVPPEPRVFPQETVVAEAPAAPGLRPMTGLWIVKTPPQTWPAVTQRPLSPKEQDLENKLLSGEIGADSTVFAALSRNLRQWPNAVIVCDLTTSMDPYAAQIYAWFRRNAKKPNVNGVVFFTDCDSLGQQTRPNGPPGAFFTTRERDPRAALPTLLAAARNTANNRDGDENVVEALRYAQRTFPQSKHLILLADNGSGVKDMPLLAGLKKPVHVIACGEPLNNANPFHPEHYQIAQQTGGSIHTLEDDVEPNQLTRSTFIRVGTHYYRYSPRQKRFVKTRFERRPVRVLGVRL